MLMKKQHNIAQQTNINVGEPVQKVAMAKVLVDKSTQTDDLGGSYNLFNNVIICFKPFIIM
jgi:hypothetical protein